MMNNMNHPPGKTTIAPDVLISIARLSTLAVDGVSRMSTIPTDVNQFFKRGLGASEGVRIAVEDNAVYADIYVIMQCDVNVREVCHNIQAQVARAISEMVGMEVGKVNIHVEDIDYTSKAESAPL
jgi:uncharacterized alkaline shock family protein YloU